MISATIFGKLGKDAETRAVGDKKVINFSVATRYGFGDNEKTTWVDVALWRSSKISEYLKTGTSVVVRGEMYMREYEHNGEPRKSLTLNADDVRLAGSKSDAPPRTQTAMSADDDIPF